MNGSSRLAPSFLPRYAILELTYHCNHSCLFCSCPWEAPSGGLSRHPELTAGEWKDVVSQLAAMGVGSFAFTGGEPLLKEGFTDIIAHAASLSGVEHIRTAGKGRSGLVSRFGSPRLYVISNGSAVDEALLDFLAGAKAHLSMSLPGLRTYGLHTGGGASPDAVLHGFRMAADRGVSTTVNVTVTARNLHELRETIDAAFSAGAGSLLLNRFLPGGRGLRNTEGLLLSGSQVVRMLQTADEALVSADRSGGVGTEIPACLMDGRLPTFKRLEVHTRCSAARRFFVIGPSGHVRTCNHSPVELVHWSRIEHLRLHPYWKRFALGGNLPAVCGSCTRDCDGGCREAAHVMNGRTDSPDYLLTSENLP